MDPLCIAIRGRLGKGKRGGVVLSGSYAPFSSHNLTGVTTSIPSLFWGVSNLFVAILFDGAAGGVEGGESELHEGKKSN